MGCRIKPEASGPESNRIREVISIDSSDSSSSSSYYSGLGLDGSDGYESDLERSRKKRQRMEAVLPVGFLDPIRQAKRTFGQITGTDGTVRCDSRVSVKQETVSEGVVAVKKQKEAAVTSVALTPSCKQFWKAGDYEGRGDCGKFSDEDMDHVRVHPKFLHSNATSHKWALGAFAELLDNALDEYCNGATYVSTDVLENMKDGSKMVMVQDNGGGMTPDKMRQCMSLGYSTKSKIANTIGQYGNGFKTSTMRLGADVIVFSRCQGKHGGRCTQTIGLLSFTFLRSTGKEDIVVPMIDYERKGKTWSKYVKTSSDCWQRNLETIAQWSPYESEEDLLEQFNFLDEQGTRIIIYNLWEDEEGSPELDFDTDKKDIQIRGDDRDDQKMALAKKYPSCRHFVTYRHSLRSYASILYFRIPPGFRIILRGKVVDHHDIITDLMHTNDLVYKPAACADAKDPNMSAKVKLGFVKDAIHHIDVQGFNVYHKNRLIKPFWRVWSAAGSDGRGVIGVLEANFVEPAHDKQGFERTIALSRLEARLQHFQKTYWSSNCHLVGYAQRRHPKKSISPVKDKSNSKNNAKGNIYTMETRLRSEHETHFRSRNRTAPLLVQPESECPFDEAAASATKGDESVPSTSITDMVLKLEQEKHNLCRSLKNALEDLQYERDKNKSLEDQLQRTKKMMAKMDQEQEMFVSAFSDERGRREEEEENMRAKLRDAADTIEALLKKVKMLEAARK